VAGLLSPGRGSLEWRAADAAADGAPLTALAAAGRLRELRRGALVPASVAFGWHRAPSATENF